MVFVSNRKEENKKEKRSKDHLECIDTNEPYRNDGRFLVIGIRSKRIRFEYIGVHEDELTDKTTS